ncbi:threonine/serine ThrE exporter family protein [Rarobacter incanus]|nr:threonine/serine exporter family protein [Rarobacter incanus]
MSMDNPLPDPAASLSARDTTPAATTGQSPATAEPGQSPAACPCGQAQAAPEQEHLLEPVQLIRQASTALRAGRLMLAAGCGSYRVRSAMNHTAKALGLDRVESQVSVTDITATAWKGEIFRTEVVQGRGIGVNSARIVELENYTSNLTDATVEEVDQFLDEVEARPHLYSTFVSGAFSGLACAGFAFLNKGGAIECAIVFVAAMLGHIVRRVMLERRFNQFAVTLFAGLVAASAYLLVARGLYSAGVLADVHASGYVSAVLFLVPGFPLITAALDLSRMDFTAGISRLAYALMLLTCAAISVWVVSALFGLAPNESVLPHMPWQLLLALRVIASALAAFGFAILFNSPVRLALWAALIGAIANSVRLEAFDAGMIAQAAAGIGGLLVGILANIIAPRIKVPRLTLCVPAVVIMVPGAAVYRAIYYLNDSQTLEAMAWGVQAAFVVLALAIGLMLARTVTDRDWGSVAWFRSGRAPR